MAVDLEQPQIIAAVIGGGFVAVVSLVVAVVNQLFTQSMHRQKLKADYALTERKINADIELARLKVELDKDLNERKFSFEKEAFAWRRRYDLAEQILSSAYEVRDALSWARVRVVLKGEGGTRQASGPENPVLKENRNSAFIPIERLTANAKAFAALQTAQDTAGAHFGPCAVSAIIALFAEHRTIAAASSSLIEHAAWNDDPSGDIALQPFRDELWDTGKATSARQRIDAAIQHLESICKPVLLVPSPM